MASPPITPPGAPPPGGGGAPAAAPAAPPTAGGVNPLQIIAAITRLAQMLAQASPSASPDAEQIIQSVQSAARKLIPQQPEARQQSPF